MHGSGEDLVVLVLGRRRYTLSAATPTPVLHGCQSSWRKMCSAEARGGCWVQGRVAAQKLRSEGEGGDRCGRWVAATDARDALLRGSSRGRRLLLLMPPLLAALLAPRRSNLLQWHNVVAARHRRRLIEHLAEPGVRQRLRNARNK